MHTRRKWKPNKRSGNGIESTKFSVLSQKQTGIKTDIATTSEMQYVYSAHRNYGNRKVLHYELTESNYRNPNSGKSFSTDKHQRNNYPT